MWQARKHSMVWHALPLQPYFRGEINFHPWHGKENATALSAQKTRIEHVRIQLCLCLCLKQPTLRTVSTHTASWLWLDDELIASIKETVTRLRQDWNVTSLDLPKVRLCQCFWWFWWLGQNFSKWSSAQALANCLTKLFEPGELVCQASACKWTQAI